MRRRLFVLAAVLALLLAACSSSHRSTAPPTTTAPTTTTTTDAPPGPNPDVIPPVITPAYVDAVFKVLNHINGNAVRALLSEKAITKDVTAELQAIYGGPLYPIELQVFQQGLSQGFTNLRNPPGDRETRTVSLISASQACIFVQTVSDLAAVEIHPTSTAAVEYWRLQRKSSQADQWNPTPWILTYNQDFRTPTTLQNQC